jgi:hypothetical protein
MTYSYSSSGVIFVSTTPLTRGSVKALLLAYESHTIDTIDTILQSILSILCVSSLCIGYTLVRIFWFVLVVIEFAYE